MNEAYDFNSIEGINSIPVPCREVNGGSATGRVEYYLRGTCFFSHWNAGRTELALACLRKAQELMFVSDMIWKRSDFLRLVEYLYEAGKDEEAELQLRRIDRFFENQNVVLDMIKNRLESARELRTDLLEITNSGPCCAECAKYRNRIFSISGKDKRFPALPNIFKPKSFNYNHVCLSFWPFIEGVHEPSFPIEIKSKKQLIKYSNRPFIDERTPEEINSYDEWYAMMCERQEKEARQEQWRIENAKKAKEDMDTLQWLQENLPSLAPKSLTGFRRMRTTNSRNYQKVVEAARKIGKALD